uniref:Uncharacterized protein n=1 Tax=Oryza glumipatula TaxID=40148 RepID=A0A0E0BVA7_9ORYZ
MGAPAPFSFVSSSTLGQQRASRCKRGDGRRDRFKRARKQHANNSDLQHIICGTVTAAAGATDSGWGRNWEMLLPPYAEGGHPNILRRKITRKNTIEVVKVGHAPSTSKNHTLTTQAQTTESGTEHQNDPH